MRVASIWRAGAKGWQLALIGTNAHANRDLCQALVNHFTERDIRQYKKLLLGFQLPIATVYYPFFDQLKAENSNLTLQLRLARASLWFYAAGNSDDGTSAKGALGAMTTYIRDPRLS